MIVTSGIASYIIGVLSFIFGILAIFKGHALRFYFDFIILSCTIAGTTFSQLAPYFNAEDKVFGLLFGLLIFVGALVGGVVGILLPKISTGISLGLLISIFISLALLAVMNTVLSPLISTTLAIIMVSFNIYFSQIQESLVSAIRLSIAAGLSMTVLVDIILKWNMFFTMASLLPLSGISSNSPSSEFELVGTWFLSSVIIFLLHSCISGNWKHGQFQYFKSSVRYTDETRTYSSVQRTFSYPDTLVCNYFDPDALPHHLQGHAEIIFTTVQSLALEFGFQIDNSRNQAEHFLLMLYNECKYGEHILTEPPARLHRHMFANYRKWCQHLSIQPLFMKKVPGMAYTSQIEDILMYMLIWGEAANIRFLPEGLCFIYHKLMQERLSSVNGGEKRTKSSSLYPGFFLDHVVTPIYEVISIALKSGGDHVNRKTYDDFNEFFWSPECLKYPVRDPSLDDTSTNTYTSTNGNVDGLNMNSRRNNREIPVSLALQNSSKTYAEKRSWLHPLLSFHRILEWHAVTFTLLAVWGFSNNLVWSWKFTFQVASTVFLEITFFGIIWTCLEVWALYPQTQMSGPSICGYLVRMFAGYVVMVYQVLYLYWSFDDSNEPHSGIHGSGDANFWWWQYIWLSLVALSIYAFESVVTVWIPSFTSALLESKNSLIQALLNICYPLSQLYVGKRLHVPQAQVAKYNLFWVTLLGFKILFGYRFIVHPICTPSLLFYDDYMNYDEISFAKTMTMLLILWGPHFIVYLIDLSIWYSVWSALVGGFNALSERQGAVRDLRTMRGHFMRAPGAFFLKMMPPLDGQKHLGQTQSVSRTTITALPVTEKNTNDINKQQTKSKVNNNINNHNTLNKKKKMMSTADLNHYQYQYVNDDIESNMQPSTEQDITAFLDIRSQRWVIFGRVWNEVMNKLRAGDLISTEELNMYLFSNFEWLSKPVYLPLFQTAGYVELALHGYLESVVLYESEEDIRGRLQVVDNFSTSLDVTTTEAVTETWELTKWFLTLLLGNAHKVDVTALFSALERWAMSTDELYSCIKASMIQQVFKHITNIVSILKNSLAKRKSNPILTAEKTAQYGDDSSMKSNGLSDHINGGLSRGSNANMKKSVSTGFLIGLDQDDDVNTMEASLNPSRRRFAKLQPLRQSQGLDDTLRDKVRDEVRNLLSSLRSALRTSDITPLGQDLVDRLTFILSMESGFVHSDMYASVQLDDFAKDSNTSKVIYKLNGLLRLRQPQVELTSLEAKRRLHFFVNSLFMDMPYATTLRYSKEYTCITPYYSEDVLLSKKDLLSKNSDGVSTILYLQTLYKKDWLNFIHRLGIQDEQDIFDPEFIQETRIWASLRAQTLFRTVEGMMQSEAAVRLLAELEGSKQEDTDFFGKVKFNYVVSCQVYGTMKKNMDSKADDIEFLLKRHPNLRIAYMDSMRTNREGGLAHYSVLIKADKDKIKEVFRVKLPGHAVIGEGKPENQNHALIFTRGRYLQAIDMNQDGYFEEALKMRNLLDEFDHGHAIVGFREHIFTGSVSSVANYMALQELSFVSLGQRVLTNPLQIRQHYGHPDLFDKLFVMTEGSMSKASKGINLSEDVFAGYNATIRGHTVGFKEYAQVGKGRDVGLQQTYKFEAKLSQGNAEQCLSRDISRICDRLDFFRLCSFYFGGIGHYTANTMVMVALVVVTYCMVGLAVYGEEGINGRKMDPEGTLQMVLAGMGLLQTFPLITTLTVEKGLFSAFADIAYMMLSGGPLYFIFQIQTKSFYFMQTILAGGAKYRPTGRGFVTRHSPFDENYRFFASSHIYIGFEVFVALVLLACYTTSEQYFGLTWAIWLVAISFLLGPFWFNPLSFETSKVKEDYYLWQIWMQERGGTSEQSWEVWWREENNYLIKLPISWKFWLLLFRVLTHGLVAIGIFGTPFASNPKEQYRVCLLLSVFAAYSIVNWTISKVESLISYAFRRLAGFLNSLTVWITICYLFAVHVLYFKYTIALYYVGSVLSYTLLACGIPIPSAFKIHDYLVGHLIFCMLFILSLCQAGAAQTWLLFHNALSSGVEIEAVLKFARRTKEAGSAAPRAPPADDIMADLQSQIAEQAKIIKALVASATSQGGPVNEELLSLLAKEDDVESIGESTSSPVQSFHARTYGSTAASMKSTSSSETDNTKNVAGFDFLQPTTFPKR